MHYLNKDQGHPLTSTSHIVKSDSLHDWVDKTVQSTHSGDGTEQPSISGKAATFENSKLD